MQPEIIWEEPDFDALKKRKGMDHWDAVVDRLAEKPGEWARIGEFSYSYAYVMVRKLTSHFTEAEFIRGPEMTEKNAPSRAYIYARIL